MKAFPDIIDVPLVGGFYDGKALRTGKGVVSVGDYLVIHSPHKPGPAPQAYLLGPNGEAVFREKWEVDGLFFSATEVHAK